ncbi:phosphoglycerate dehydrogenase [Pendulispora albinea]|uniref:phosphoglycerate dehydrogenase n=1 Tax=Pendulispora albinea TaxID=2741071 RepID=UPI00374DFF4A
MAKRPFPGSATAKPALRVLLCENIHPSANEAFSAADLHIETLSYAPKEEELRERLRDIDVLGIRSKTLVRASTLEHAHRLLSIGCFCIGTNQVDIHGANMRGVPVFNAPFSNTRSVAEMILAEVVMLARQLGDRSREVHDGQWRKVATGCYEVRGKTLGIVGYGHIGTQVGILAEAFGMRVLYFDIATKLPIGNARSVASLGELLANSDFVTLHVPATRETSRMIGSAELSVMKKGGYLLNASRGQVVDIDALATAIRSKHLGGAAVDVYPEEPESNGDQFASELRNLPNVILTPHVGGSTEEAQESIGREVSIALTKFVVAGTTAGAVNFPAVELPQVGGTHRVLNVHRNVPGVLRDINRIVSDRNANIHSQVLATDANIGYLIMDLDQDVSADVCSDIAALSTNIRTRISN